jgi:hypothetical protein
MRIPMGNFGLDTPTTVQTNVSGAGMAAASEALAQAGANGYQSAAKIQTQQQNEFDDLVRAKAGNAVLDREVQVKSLTERLQQQLADGTLKYDKYEDAYNQELSKLEAPTVDGMDEVTALNYQKGLKRVDLSGLTAMRAAGDQARQAEYKGQTDLAIDSFQKLAGMPGANIEQINQQVEALDGVGRVAYGAQWEAVKQGFKDSNWQNHAVQAAMQVRDSTEGLSKLEKELTDENGFYVKKLDPDKRNAVLRQVQNDRYQLEYRQQAQADRAEAKAERAVLEIDRQLATGVPATPEMWNAWSSNIRGTSFEGDYNDRLNQEKEVQGVLRMPVEKQMSFIQEREAKLNNEGGTISEATNLARMKSAVENNLKLLQEQPLLFHESRGGEEIPPLDVNALLNPETAGVVTEQMADRVAIIQSSQVKFGPQVQMRPLLPQEVSQLAAGLEQATPGQSVQLFASLRKAFANDDAYQAAIQQIAPDSPVTSLAGSLAIKQTPITLVDSVVGDPETASGANVAKLLLDGEAILNKNKSQQGKDGTGKGIPMPTEQEFRDNFANIAGNVFAGNPQAYEIAYQATRSYYAGRTAQDGDISGIADMNRMEQSVKAVLGNVVDYNGNGEVLAPWGMPGDVFIDRIEQALDAKAKELNLSEDVRGHLDSVGLQTRGDGSYFVLQGRSYLTDAQGNPIILDLNGKPKQ